MTDIDISRIHYPVTTLGPGHRVGIWFQGCSIRCPGCISVDTWAAGRGRTTVELVMEMIEQWIDVADGVTISGGEPFDQPVPLFVLLQRLRMRSSGDIFLYTGYAFDELAEQLGQVEGLIDALISEPYVESAPQTLPLRGSDNQHLHLLTPRGQQFSRYDAKGMDRTQPLDVMFGDDGTIWLAGIPHRGDLSRLRQLLEAAGHRADTSECQPWREEH